jgi:hypothetical protein
MKIRKPVICKYWTKEEEFYVLNNSIEDSMKFLNRTKKSIEKRRTKLEMTKKRNFWTDIEDNFILTHTIEESVIKLNRTKQSIYARKFRL